MTKSLSWLSFIIGAVIVVWMGTAFMGTNLLALIITCAIAGVYVLGFSELIRYQKESYSLHRALDQETSPVQDLPTWLGAIAPALQLPVQQRITQDRSAIPTPIMTPYLIGLLVLLGLIGTFIGMVGTLKGAVIALESNTELEAIRSGLAAPMKGLGMAFGTSVAGVSASAALGLISTLSRRDRLHAWRKLEAVIPSTFAAVSINSERQRTYAALQQQADHWPNLVEQLSQLANNIETLGKNVCDTLTQQQKEALADTASSVTDMTSKLQTTLQHELETTTQQMSALVEPVVERVLSQGQNQIAAAHEQWQQTNREHLATQMAALRDNSADLQNQWRSGIEEQHVLQRALIEAQKSWAERIQQDIGNGVEQSQRAIGEHLQQWLQQQQDDEQQRREHINATNQQWLADIAEGQKQYHALLQQQKIWATSLQEEISEQFSQSQTEFGQTLRHWLEQQQQDEQARREHVNASNQQWLADIAANQSQYKALLAQQNHWAETLQQEFASSIEQTKTEISATLGQWLALQEANELKRQQTISDTNQQVFDEILGQQKQQGQWQQTLQQAQQELQHQLRNQFDQSVVDAQKIIGETLQTWLQEQKLHEQERRQLLEDNTLQVYEEILVQQEGHNQLLKKQGEWAQELQQHVRNNLIQTQNELGQTLKAWLQQQSDADQARLDAIGAGNQTQFNDLIARHQQHADDLNLRQQTLADSIASVVSGGEALLDERRSQESQWYEQQQKQAESFIAAAKSELGQLQQAEQQRNQAAIAGFEQLQASMSEQLERLTEALQTPMSELMQTAAESPKAAAEVLSQLRQEMTSALERDNQMLQERQSIMEQLDQLATSLASATTEQRDAIMSMTEASSTMLAEVSERFSAKIDTDIDKLATGIDQVAASSIDMATLAETFGQAVQDYQSANSQLLEHFGSLEAQIAAMNDRSDEQMGYYVAQAREIIDHSLSSQQEMIEQLRRLGRETVNAG
ncbi:hypothetical protein [Halioxenophilus aromaticivorans]|uniref:DUF802 domain-containing protein n=1 Tax=Halioxenophilus aromaticivorans TaxID=1306992 RepID=A0AAV3TYL5_9ALTE